MKLLANRLLGTIDVKCLRIYAKIQKKLILAEEPVRFFCRSGAEHKLDYCKA
jgi:hypothetical protein